MIVKVGATPVFVDCDLGHAQHRPRAGRGARSVRARGRSCRRTGRARSSTWTRSTRSRSRHGLRVIEDAALVLGSRWQRPPGRRVRRPRHVQLPSEQEHDVDRGRRARRATMPPKRGASRCCASTASSACPTARATSRSPAASSTCPTSTRASALAQLARLPAVPRAAAHARRALFRALRDRARVRAAAAARRRRRPVVEHVLRAAAARRDAHLAQGVPRRARGARHRAPACRTRRCTCPRSAGASATSAATCRTPSASRATTVTLPLHAGMTLDDVDRVCAACARHASPARGQCDDGAHAAACRSSFRSTTRRRACRRCSRGCIRRSTRSASRYEVIFVNDGSRDRSAALLREQFPRGPTSRASSCSTPTTASTSRSSRASSACAASAS